jgi:hypothetical protein
MTDNGEWVEGDLVHYSEKTSNIVVDIVGNLVYDVHTDTVGQFTGMYDLNGERVFEGDIIQRMVSSRGRSYLNKNHRHKKVVAWNDKEVGWNIRNFMAKTPSSWIVTGNIHMEQKQEGLNL